MLCKTLEVHPSGYYQWLHKPLSNRKIEDEKLTGQIKHHWIDSGGHSGYRNLHLDLIEAKIDCGRDRVLRLMQSAGIKAIRGYKAPKTNHTGMESPAAPNLLDRQFLYARNIVGWAMGHRMTADLVLDALTMAYWRRKPTNKVMIHSDQGSQYSSRECKKLLKILNMEASMSRRGNCHDNAVAESFFSNLKKERVRRIKYKTRADARQDVFNYIEMFYNPKRRHTHNNRVAPMIYEQRFFENQKSV